MPPRPSLDRPEATALHVVLALTVLVGLIYPLTLTAAAQVPGLRHSANGSLLIGTDGRPVGSSLIGQSFTDGKGNPLRYCFQSRPSHAGDGYDASASGAGNQGPESVVDTIPTKGDPGKQSLLTQVCTRSKQVGELEHVDGSRPYCTPDGVGAVLGAYRAHGTTGAVQRAVSLNQACPTRPFTATYQGVVVECARRPNAWACRWRRSASCWRCGRAGPRGGEGRPASPDRRPAGRGRSAGGGTAGVHRLAAPGAGAWAGVGGRRCRWGQRLECGRRRPPVPARRSEATTGA
ncbi:MULTISPECIES: potassium-transporting ATPase subunit C [unclassified Streptomyces]|uniref:potassium-transporting ATPase subunit C n=1 Tax=unclassified Streptomyces TaxID=2593676 RepID=UPI003D8A7589